MQGDRQYVASACEEVVHLQLLLKNEVMNIKLGQVLRVQVLWTDI